MATIEQRDVARAKVFESITYWPHEKATKDIEEILKDRFDWGNLEDLINDANSNAELGYSNFNSEFTTAPEEIIARLQGYAEEIVHEQVMITGRHRLRVNEITGQWFPSRQPAWNGNICATLNENGEPIIIRTIPIIDAKVEDI